MATMLSVRRLVFDYAVEPLVDSNPCVGIASPEAKRPRYITDAEMVAVWAG
jgi:hypothetical protein